MKKTTLIPKNKEADSSTEEPTQRKCEKEKKEGISGLRVMGVFVGCGVLMILGWGG